jgi:hypothetical protein
MKASFHNEILLFLGIEHTISGHPTITINTSMMEAQNNFLTHMVLKNVLPAQLHAFTISKYEINLSLF